MTRGEALAGVAGILTLLIMIIFKWFAVEVGGGDIGAFAVPTVGESGNAFGSYGFTDFVLLITCIVAVDLALIAALGAGSAEIKATSQIVAGLGIVSVVLIVISIISPPDFGLNLPETGGIVDIAHVRKIGVWLGLISTAAVAIGGWLAIREEA